MTEKKRVDSKAILGIISACGGGDWPPLLALATGLRDRGHRVKVVCDAGTEAAVRAARLPAIVLPMDHSLGRFFEPRLQQLMNESRNLTPEEPNPLVDWATTCGPLVLSALKHWRPDFLLSSLLGQGLAQRLSETLRTPFCFLNPGFFFGKGARRPWEADFSTLGAQMYRNWLLPLSEKASLVLHATDAVFDPKPVPLEDHHHYVGPLFWEMPASVTEWMGEPGPPWILLSLSTSPQMGDMAIVRAALTALSAGAYRVLVTLSPEHDRSSLGKTGDHIHISGYLPHSRLLPSCCLVICHAGHGTVMKALYHGTPMVLVPWGRDQPGVAYRAESLGVARVIQPDRFNADTLAGAVSELLNDPGYPVRSAAHCRRLQAENPVDAARCRIEAFLAQNA